MYFKQTAGEKLFNAFNVVVLTFVALIALYPFIYTLSMSLSSAKEANRSSLHLYPKEISVTAYKMVFSNPAIFTGFGNAVARTVAGTILTILSTCLAAYPLARKQMPHRGAITFLILFTMIFTGGLVPNYLLIRSLGLYNSIWSLILPLMLSAFNIIIVKNFFQAIPESFGESARIDGASEFTILFRIYMPLSKPVLATIALWTAVLHWNSWFDAMIYISDDKKQVLQSFLQRIVIEGSTQLMEAGLTDPSVTEFTGETIKAATVIVTIVPIVIFYPFMQRYFLRGIMLGGIKE